MKKTSILKLFSLAAFAAAGAFVVANGVSHKKAESVSATDTSVRVNIFVDTSNSNDWAAANAITAIGCSNNISELFKFDTRDSDFPTTTLSENTTLWSEFDAYDPSGNSGEGWSGKIKGTTALVPTSYFEADWDAMRFQRTPDGIQYWGECFGGSRAALLAGNENTYIMKKGMGFYVEVDHEYHKVVLHDNSASPKYVMVAETGAYYPVAEAKEGYTFVGWYTDSVFTPENEWHNDAWVIGDVELYAKYREAIPSGRYAVGTFGGGSWDVEHGYKLPTDPDDDQQLKGELSLSYGDEFQLAWWNDSASSFDNWFGYDKLTGGAKVYFGPVDDSTNIRCYASGTYYIFAKEEGFGDGKYISVELKSALGAEHLAAKLMSYGPATPGEPGDGSCESKFEDAKSMYLNDLSPSEQTKFRGYATSDVDQFKNAYDRYIAWAAALGEKEWESGKVSGAPYVIGSTDSNNLIVIVSIVSLISASTLVGLIVIKRRRGIAK